ncbi:MAG: NUDIX domain-containing protein [Candidatus Nealsonbacteria bacterium]|nr:NUDIX domain-containing protein [Candidatus Nealsonbacteria bacterium]
MEKQNIELHRVVPTAIIHKDGKYLIVKRSPFKKAFPSRWNVPGGGLDMSDYISIPKTTDDAWYFAIENSLRREIKEEVNLEVEKPKYLLDLVFVRPDNIPVVTLSYWCQWKSGEVKLNDENIDYKWVSAEEAKNYDLISGIQEEIKMVDRILKGESQDNVKFNYNNL